MQARCKPGDVAVILYDEVECLSNVGRLVRIHPALVHNQELNLDCWLIEPLDCGAWAVSDSDGSVTLAPIGLAERIEHPDEWMLPIRDEVQQQVLTSGVNSIVACREHAYQMTEQLQPDGIPGREVERLSAMTPEYMTMGGQS